MAVLPIIFCFLFSFFLLSNDFYTMNIDGDDSHNSSIQYHHRYQLGNEFSFYHQHSMKIVKINQVKFNRSRHFYVKIWIVILHSETHTHKQTQKNK